MALVARSYVDAQLFAPTDAYYFSIDNRPLYVILRCLCALDDEMLDVLASYEELATFIIQTPTVGTTLSGIFQSLLGGTVTRVNYSQQSQGTSGSTTVDAQINGTTMFTTSPNRPSLLFSAAPAFVQQTNIENHVVPAGGYITVSMTAVQAGSPGPGRVDIFIRKAITARSYMNYILSGDAPTIDIIYSP